MTEQEHHLWFLEEKRGQRMRRLTPLGLFANLCSSGVILASLAWFWNFYATSQDKRFDLETKANDAIVWNLNNMDVKHTERFDKQQREIECIRAVVAENCGEKCHFENC